jgi:hypothetical protein
MDLFLFDSKLDQIIKTQKEILSQMSTTNTTISQLAASFTSFQGDATKFFADSSAFYTALQTFLTSLQNQTGETVLSAADQETVNTLAAGLAPLDAQAKALDATLSAITIPTPPAPPAPVTPTPAPAPAG